MLFCISIFKHEEITSFQMELAQIFFKDGRPIDLEGRLNPETCASLF